MRGLPRPQVNLYRRLRLVLTESLLETRPQIWLGGGREKSHSEAGGEGNCKLLRSSFKGISVSLYPSEVSFSLKALPVFFFFVAFPTYIVIFF